jgi:hypothetical protein
MQAAADEVVLAQAAAEGRVLKISKVSTTLEF